jgi:hypothetical protein
VKPSAVDIDMRLGDLFALFSLLGIGAATGQPFLGAAFAAGMLWRSATFLVRVK